MFVDASAMVALLSDEAEAARISNALTDAFDRFTSPVAIFEAIISLSRADKFNLPTEQTESLVLAFVDQRGIEIRDMPPAPELAKLSLSALHRYRSGRRGLNLGDCMHYACAKYHSAPMLATANEFRQTDLETIA